MDVKYFNLSVPTEVCTLVIRSCLWLVAPSEINPNLNECINFYGNSFYKKKMQLTNIVI